MKKKFIALASLLCFGMATIEAQVTDLEKQIRDESGVTGEVKEKKWDFSGVVSLNASQASFTNWSAGGENSVGGNALVSLSLKYKGINNSWDNTLDIGYGALVQGEKLDDFRKTDDRIDFVSKYGQRASKHWFYAAMVNFKTQMTNGYDYTIKDENGHYKKTSCGLTPGNFIGAIGMDYKPFPVLSAFISPITAKLIFVADTAYAELHGIKLGEVGVNSKGSLKTECGGYIRVVYDQSFFDNKLTIVSKLDLFTNYLHNPQNVDVSWENIISLKISKYISAMLTTHLIYDDDIKTTVENEDGTTSLAGPRIQFKEILGIGLAYKF